MAEDNIEEFDLEKYRNETPMDYLKAISLINEDPSNGIVMNTIYRVTRLHISDLVYKYYSLSNNEKENSIKLSTLLNKKVYLSDPKSFNDPFDNKAFFYRSEYLARHERLKRWNGKFIDDFSSYVRLSSFTSNGINNMPMWAHYANNHQGYCVAYDTDLKDNILLRASLFPVQYIDERIDITSIIDSFVSELETLIEKSKKTGEKRIGIDNLIIVWISIYYACLKHSTWGYEKELRCVISSASKGAPYIDATPSAIYMGAKCSALNQQQLFNIAYKLDIPVYQMVFNEYSLRYELKQKQLR